MNHREVSTVMHPLLVVKREFVGPVGREEASS